MTERMVVGEAWWTSSTGWTARSTSTPAAAL